MNFTPDVRNAVFKSGFRESSNFEYKLSVSSQSDDTTDLPSKEEQALDAISTNRNVYEDSDEEDEDNSSDVDDSEGEPANGSEQDEGIQVPSLNEQDIEMEQSGASDTHALCDSVDSWAFPSDNTQERNVRQKLSHPASPRSVESGIESEQHMARPGSTSNPADVSRVRLSLPTGPKKAKVVVNDVAYATYRAVLFYVSQRTLSCQ